MSGDRDRMGPAQARAGLLDLRVPKRAAAALRALAAGAEGLAPGRIALVALHGSRALGTASRGTDYDVAVFVEGANDVRSLEDELRDLCFDHVLDGIRIHVAAFAWPGADAVPLALQALRDGIAIAPRKPD